MDYKLLSIVVALRAMDRGALLSTALEVAEQVVARVQMQPGLDLLQLLLVIDQEFSARNI